MEHEIAASEQAQICRTRAGYYQFLARLFYEELTDEFIDQFVESQTVLPLDPAASESEHAFAQGTNRMVKYLTRRTPDTLAHTRCDFARIFLGAGSVTKVPVSPFESVYANEGRLIMQGSRDAACALYAAEGLEVEDSYNMPEDHISFEFQYLALLLNRQASALDAAESATTSQEQTEASALADTYEMRSRAFFEDHVAPWVPLFCEEARSLAETTFYQGLLQATGAWVALECVLLGLDGLAAQTEVRALAADAHAKAKGRDALLHGSAREVA